MLHSNTTYKKACRKTAIIFFWLAVWQLAAIWTDNAILLAGPLEAAEALVKNMAAPDFWKTVLYSAGRISFGFAAAFATGVLAGSLAWRFALLREMASVLISVAKAVPVAVFTVILLIWTGSEGLTVWISFLIVFPQVYTSTIAGLTSTDRQLLEMAQVMETPQLKKFFFIYRPALMPYLISCCQSALGMSWKSGVAAEVIGTPAFSIGERLYLSKIYLDTAGIFAWAFVIILLSLFFEKVFLFLLKRYAGRTRPLCHIKVYKAGIEAENAKPENLIVEKIGYDYDTQEVLRDITMTLQAGKRYCLMGKSGRGKTTLLHLMAGLLIPKKGYVSTLSCSLLFQEDRLCEQADAVQNVCMAKGVDEETAIRHLEQVLDKEDCLRPVCELSGGMRRRVALCRAVAAGGDVLLLDEPFNGLDEENRERAARYLRKEQRGRILVASTHRGEETELLAAEQILLS